MASQESQPFHWHYSEIDDHNFQIRGRTFFFAVAIFSLILLTTLLLLYARWICGLNQLPSAADASYAPHQAHARAPPPQPQGLDAATINSYPIVLHDSSKATAVGESRECCICLGVFEHGEKVKVLPNCGHCFHDLCVDKWLGTHPSCPLCRTSLRADSPV